MQWQIGISWVAAVVAIAETYLHLELAARDAVRVQWGLCASMDQENSPVEHGGIAAELK